MPTFTVVIFCLKLLAFCPYMGGYGFETMKATDAAECERKVRKLFSDQGLIITDQYKIICVPQGDDI